MTGRFGQERRGEDEHSNCDDVLSEPMYVRYVREVERDDDHLDYSKTIYHRINRPIVYYCGTYFCLFEIGASHCSSKSCESYSCEKKEENVQKKTSPLKQVKNSPSLSFKCLPRVMMIFYLMSFVYMLVALYYQYEYDFARLRLLKLKERMSCPELARSMTSCDGGISWQVNEELISNLNKRMSEARSYLKFIGADNSHLAILAECFYLVILIQTGNLFLLALHYRLQTPFDHHVVSDLIDKKREEENIFQMVKRQVSEFIESNRVYRSNSKVECQFDRTQVKPKETCEDFVAAIKRQSESGRVERLAREMLSCGALTPLYQSRAWLARRTKLQFGYHLVIALCIIYYYLSLVGGLFLLANNEFASSSTDPQVTSSSSQSLVHVACISLMLIVSPTGFLHTSTFLLTVSEQMAYIEQLRLMIRQCANTSSYQKRTPRKMITTNSSVAVAEREAQENVETELPIQFTENQTMNSNLIFCLLHYKIFVAQLARIKDSLGVMNITQYIMLFTTPIIARLHEPYLSRLARHETADQGDAGQIKLFAMGVSGFVWLPAILVLAPICSMFARCQRLYKDLSSLAAHITESRQLAPGENIYDNYAECCLLRELSDSQRLLDILTVRALGISATYKTLLEANFWYSLITISIMANGSKSEQGAQDLLSWLSSQDPLGVFT